MLGEGLLKLVGAWGISVASCKAAMAAAFFFELCIVLGFLFFMVAPMDGRFLEIIFVFWYSL